MNGNKDIQAQIGELSARLGSSCGDPDLYFQRGKLYWRMGNRAEAITDFNSAVALDPASPAQGYLDIVNDILDFYDTGQWNP